MCFSLLLNEACGRRTVWAMGQGDPQLSNRLHGGPSATLTHAEPSSHRTGNKHFQLSPGKSGAMVSLVTTPLKVKNCQSCQSSERFTTHLQICSAVRKENTAHKGWLAKTVIISGAAYYKGRQVVSKHSWLRQASHFPLFSSNFPRKDIYQQAPAPCEASCREGEQPRLPSRAGVNADPLGLLTSLFTVWSHLAQANIKIFCF